MDLEANAEHPHRKSASARFRSLLPRAAISKLFTLTPLGFTAALLRLLFLCHNMLDLLSLLYLARVHGSVVECKHLPMATRSRFLFDTS